MVFKFLIVDISLYCKYTIYCKYTMSINFYRFQYFTVQSYE